MPAPAQFSAATRPWIQTRTGTRYQDVGLYDLLCRAHTIEDLAVPVPPAASAVLRIAVALTARLTGLDDPDLDAEQWNRLRNHYLTRVGRLPTEAADRYFSAHHFEVFDPVRPWLQDPALAHQCPAPTGLNTLIVGRPAGNNLAWLAPHTDDDPHPVPTGQALQHLLVHHYYGRSGGHTARTAGTVSSHYARSGPLRGTVSFHPLGRTLFETLLAGIPKLTGEQTAQDLLPWEEPDPPDPLAAPAQVTWPGRQLLGHASHAVLLVPADNGTSVTDAYLTWATCHQAPTSTDPYVIVHTDPARPLERRRSLRRADIDRAWWRDLDALLLAPDETRRHRRPAVFDTLGDLPEPLRSRLRVRVHGFDQDTKTIDHQWYTALTPALLDWAQEHDPVRAQRIAECCQGAELAARRLAQAADQAWEAATVPGGGSGGGQRRTSTWARRARALYWPLARMTFWRLLEQTDTDVHTAFMQAAVSALAGATRADRARHAAAPRALAHATRTLRRPPAPTTRRSTP